MTQLMKGIIAVFSFLTLISCGETPQGATAKSGIETPQSQTIAGKVSSISYGKDGYTATVNTVENGTYAALVSIVNLGGPDNYQSVKINDEVIFSGVPSTLNGEKRLMVKKIIEVTPANQGFNVEAIALNEKYSAIATEEYCWLAMKKVELRDAPNTTAKVEGPHFQGEVLKVLDSKIINNELWVNVQFTLQVKTGYEDHFADGQVMSTGSPKGWIGGTEVPLIRCK